MLVCRACHQLIHGLLPFGKSILIMSGSLAYQGDDGFGTLGVQWREYLKSKEDSHGQVKEAPSA